MSQLRTLVTLSKSRSEVITMPMICSLIQHGFLTVFSIVGKIVLYSDEVQITALTSTSIPLLLLFITPQVNFFCIQQ